MEPSQFRKLPGLLFCLMVFGASFLLAAEENLNISRVNLGPEVNTKQDEIDMTVGVDGDLLIFPAHREDSIEGSHDLYLSRRVDALWSKPINLGPRINTPGNDTCPWLAYDGHTLSLDSDWEGLVGGWKGKSAHLEDLALLGV